jgi:hypothetical protein
MLPVGSETRTTVIARAKTVHASSLTVTLIGSFMSINITQFQRGIIYPQKLVQASQKSGGRSVGIVRSRTQAMEFVFVK